MQIYFAFPYIEFEDFIIFIKKITVIARIFLHHLKDKNDNIQKHINFDIFNYITIY